MIYKLNTDLSNITNIPKLSLDNLSIKSMDCIAYCVQENLVEKDPVTSIDIGIGVLHIKLKDSEIAYKFIPNNYLENQLTDLAINKQSKLTLKLENAIAERISSTYKGLY